MDLFGLESRIIIENDTEVLQKLSELSKNLENAQRLLAELKKETLTIKLEPFAG